MIILMLSADHTDMYADDRDADGGGNCLHCLLLSHQHCLGEAEIPKLSVVCARTFFVIAKSTLVLSYTKTFQ